MAFHRGLVAGGAGAGRIARGRGGRVDLVPLARGQGGRAGAGGRGGQGGRRNPGLRAGLRREVWSVMSESASSCLAVIPARGGSRGVPRKNVRLLAGRPLIAWTIQAA